jgi:hypothetical protein
MMSGIHSFQLTGSKSSGGAERWFQRFSIGYTTETGVRRDHEPFGNAIIEAWVYAKPLRTSLDQTVFYMQNDPLTVVAQQWNQPRPEWYTPLEQWQEG